MVHTGPGGHVFQKPMTIAGEQIHIPIEGHAESGLPLLCRRLPMRKEDLQIHFPGQRTKPRRLVLDGVAGENAETHGVKRSWKPGAGRWALRNRVSGHGRCSPSSVALLRRGDTPSLRRNSVTSIFHLPSPCFSAPFAPRNRTPRKAFLSSLSQCPKQLRSSPSPAPVAANRQTTADKFRRPPVPNLCRRQT